MQLDHLITCLPGSSVHGAGAGREIRGIVFDSRKVLPGFLFVAVRGTQVDGHAYIHQAVNAGAEAIVAERGEYLTRLGETGELPVILVDDTAAALALLADAWYGSPSRSMRVVGITGTNGKTTVATLLHDLFTALGYRSGLLSTVEIRIGTDKHKATHTTPDALTIQENLAAMRDAGVDYAFMEVSSHACINSVSAAFSLPGGSSPTSPTITSTTTARSPSTSKSRNRSSTACPRTVSPSSTLMTSGVP